MSFRLADIVTYATKRYKEWPTTLNLDFFTLPYKPSGS